MLKDRIQDVLDMETALNLSNVGVKYALGTPIRALAGYNLHSGMDRGLTRLMCLFSFSGESAATIAHI